MSKLTRYSEAQPVLAILAWLLLSLAGPVATAQADSLDTARAQGVVGERYDGLVVVRDQNASAAVHSLVKQINAKRRELYSERAASEGAPVDQVGRVYARQIFQSVPSGTWFLQENGQWVQK